MNEWECFGCKHLTENMECDLKLEQPSNDSDEECYDYDEE